MSACIPFCHEFYSGKGSLARTFATIILISLVIYNVLFTLGFFNVGPRDATGIVRNGTSIVFTGIGLYV